jgi:hypothetical protein
LAWWKNKKYHMLLSFVGCVMAISKGALLGILLLGVVWSYYHFSKKSFALISVVFAGLFLASYFSIGAAGQSMAVHILGFTNSLKSIITNPLGAGVGNSGVYGNLMHASKVSEIEESGLGVVIGQLGIVGLILYVTFFINQFNAIHKYKDSTDNRTLIFCYSMIFTYILLIVFSESALGPNACAGFMTVIGIMCQRFADKKRVASNYYARRINYDG